MNIFFDLDGTLIDSRLRLYKLFQYLVKESTFSYETYWEFKLNKINHHSILTTIFNYTEEQYQKFELAWMAEIELKKWLDLDKPIKGVHDFLNEVSKRHTLYIVTARQSSENTLKQIQQFTWHRYIHKIMITKQLKTKVELISSMLSTTPDDWFVGDTGKDIETGKQLGINTAAVLTGFLNKKSLLTYQPNIIVDSVTQIPFP